MQQKQTIGHSGVVQSVKGRSVDVRIVSHPACIGCAASNICDVSESKEKIISAHTSLDVAVGEEVDVLMSQSQGFRALFLGYLLPFLIIMFLLITLTSLGVKELISGLIAIGSLLPYYYIIYRERARIDKSFSFSIKKQIR
jgi:sigma-E factor negative regulatory protein RseC